MASESSSQQQPKSLTPTSNIRFELEDAHIAFNNVVALLESKISLYHNMLQFLSNSYISTALTKQPYAYYSKFLREFWYIAEVESTTNTITFTLSSFDKPLSFNLDDFSTIIGLKCSENFAPLSPKETVRAALATLGLADEKDPQLLSTDLGLDIDIGNLLFSDLIVKLTTGNKGRDPNVCYTRYLSLIIEHLLGDANKMAKFSNQPEKSLILLSGEVNVEYIVDKSLFGTTMHHVSQSKAKTNKRPKKKKIPSSFDPKVSKDVRVPSSKKPIDETQHAKETVAIADATQSIDASKLAEEL
ncbi:hypothetical protein Tco_1129863, partial [Tanacetum coccineum]